MDTYNLAALLNISIQALILVKLLFPLTVETGSKMVCTIFRPQYEASSSRKNAASVKRL